MMNRYFGRHAACGVRVMLWALLAPVVTAGSNAHAVDLTVVNPGFEDVSGEALVGEFTFGPLNGWDLYDPGSITGGGEGSVFYIGTLTPTDPVTPGVIEFFPDGAPEGQRVGIAFKYSTGTNGEFGLQQTLTDVLQPNTRYELNVLVGNIASGTSVSDFFFPLDGFPGYRIDLLAGGVVIASDDNSLAGFIAEGEFAPATVVFTTGADHDQLGEDLGIRLVNLNVDDPGFPDQDIEVDFDDVRLTATAIPEPATLPLIGATLIALSTRRPRINAVHNRRL